MHGQPRMFLALGLTLAALTALQPWSARAQGGGERLTIGPAVAAPPGALPAPTSELIVFLRPGHDPAQFARSHGMVLRSRLRSAPNAFIFDTASPAHAVQAAPALKRDPRVAAAYVNERTVNVRHAFTPDDEYFNKDTPVAGWPGQWHLVNQHVAGRDARVQGAWNRDITGAGVTIGIVDDSLETGHPDLAPNYVSGDSWDFGGNDGNPDPVHDDDRHGISVAGVAAARGGNTEGVTGAAPEASLAGLRIDFPNQTTQMFLDATLFHSSGANTNIKVKNHSYGISYPYVPNAAQATALATSTAAGTIHIVSAGNERNAIGRDSNAKELQASPHSITVAAFGSSGVFSTYSCFGANVFVTAPTSSFRAGEFGVTTTDRTGDLGYNTEFDTFPDTDYTTEFGGTSSSAPLVAGVMALVKQVQPNLNTRFAKHLLARTSDVVDANDNTLGGGGDGATAGSAWKTNAAGFKFNMNYGFGLIDADELTQQAALFANVTPLKTESTGTVTVNEAVPDTGNGVAGVPNDSILSKTFSMNQTTPLEEVLVSLSVTHPSRGHLEAYLTSPSGTQSRLVLGNNIFDDNLIWTFTTNAFWGENPQGTWTLSVRDAVRLSGQATWNSYSVQTRMGLLVPLRVARFELDPLRQVVGGDDVTGMVVLNGAAPLGGATVDLSKTGASITVPASVTVPAGQTSETFTINTALVAAAEDTTVTASFNGADRVRLLRVLPWLKQFVTRAEQTGGFNLWAYVRLWKAAPPGGKAVTVTSDTPAVVPSPGVVTVPEGESLLRLLLASNPVTVDTLVTLTAELHGASLQTSSTIRRPVLRALSVAPNVYGGQSRNGVVRLSGPAAVDTTVDLSSDTPGAAQVPASVVVPAGSQSVQFHMSTSPVTADTPIILTAELNGASLQVGTTVLRAVLRAITAPAAITGGQSRTGRVWLTSPAAEDMTVTLVSDTPGTAGVPASVVVPAGAQSAPFALTTSGVAGATAVTITASLNGVDKQRTVQVVP